MFNSRVAAATFIGVLCLLGMGVAHASEGTHINREALSQAIADAIEKALPDVQVVKVPYEVEVAGPERVVEVIVAAEQAISFGGSLEAQGCAHPAGVDATYTTHLGYSYKLGSFRFRGNVSDKPRGSDCREQGLAIDLAGTQTFAGFLGDAFLDIDIGYDEHGVTGFDHNNQVVFGGVKQTTAAIMLGWEQAMPYGVARIKVGPNLANGEPRVAASWTLGKQVVVRGDCTGTGGSDPYCDASACWHRGFGDAWGAEVCYEHSNGLEYLPDPFSGRADAPASNEVNTMRVMVTRDI